MRILIVDHHQRARQSLTAFLSADPLIQQVWERDNGREALQMIEETQPDVVLMDARTLEMDGLEATRRIKSCWPQIKIVVLSMYDDCATEALAAGADAFICKGEPTEKLLATLSQLILDN
jgi:DNA-binding NarL/FixJ family response regulator